VVVVLDAVGELEEIEDLVVDVSVVLVRVVVFVSVEIVAVEVIVAVCVSVSVVFVAVRPVPPPHAQQTTAPEYPKFAYWAESELQSEEWA